MTLGTLAERKVQLGVSLWAPTRKAKDFREFGEFGVSYRPYPRKSIMF